MSIDQRPESVNGKTKFLTVGWDSEYCELGGKFYPISTQMDVPEFNKKYFLPHPGRRPSIRNLIEILHRDFPDAEGFHLVAHLNRVISQARLTLRMSV